ncbi:MAG: CTP-dependent riboflavin kinase [Alphaproteobacteria bacterium]|nr:CTP-dependent riboflavin kinase [Alphaproteobacteria bacterium]
MAWVVLSGRLVTGKGEATFFTQADWARAAFQDLVGIDPWPGTLNLQLTETADLEAWAEIRLAPGRLLRAPDPEWCDGRVYPARLEERINAAVVVPDVASYPDDQVEIIAAVQLRRELTATDGDELVIEIET